MVLRAKPTPTRFQTNTLYTPVVTTPLHSTPNSNFHEAPTVAVFKGLLMIFEGLKHEFMPSFNPQYHKQVAGVSFYQCTNFC